MPDKPRLGSVHCPECRANLAVLTDQAVNLDALRESGVALACACGWRGCNWVAQEWLESETSSRE